MSTAPELPEKTSERLKELRSLADRAEAGDPEARRELREALHESSPQVVARASDIARTGQKVLISRAAGKDPLVEEALLARLDLLRAEIAGEDPTPLEELLTERIVSLWLLVETLDVLMSMQMCPELPSEKRAPMSYLRYVFRWQESVSRRYLAALKTLAQVRKLQSNTPGIQYNTQINLRWDGKRVPLSPGPIPPIALSKVIAEIRSRMSHGCICF